MLVLLCAIITAINPNFLSTGNFVRIAQTAMIPLVLKKLGADPATGKPVVVKEGRFGPYVTDGETNASLRSGDAVETLTPERAVELLAERRAKGPAKKGGRRKANAARN